VGSTRASITLRVNLSISDPLIGAEACQVLTGATVHAPAMDMPIVVLPANEASWQDIATIFGSRGVGAVCWCQRYKLAPREAFKTHPPEERAARLRAQTHAGEPSARSTSGLVAYLDGEPVGWCAVEPRTAYIGLLRVYRTPWQGRTEDKTDAGIWAVTCFLVRAGYRGKGVSRALARATVEHARTRGARAIEAYPMISQPGEQVTWGEEHVGFSEAFRAAGFQEVSRPGTRRVVMRIDLDRAKPQVIR
jgi:GNAT superfamily N-acetyltransferase